MDEYIISDLHLGHGNIIEYCKRPFSDVDEMNEEIVKRWNKIVRPRDFVYYLGDLCLDNQDDYWLEVLNGNFHFIKGNHDKRRRGLNFAMKFYGEKRFLLVHAPQTANLVYSIEKSIADWVICGHVHENAQYINYKKGMINVSAEVLNYYPLSFIRLLDDLDKHRDFDICEKHFKM